MPGTVSEETELRGNRFFTDNVETALVLPVSVPSTTMYSMRLSSSTAARAAKMALATVRRVGSAVYQAVPAQGRHYEGTAVKGLPARKVVRHKNLQDTYQSPGKVTIRGFRNDGHEQER